MTSPAPIATPTPASDPLASAAPRPAPLTPLRRPAQGPELWLEELIRKNPLFLLSAAAILLGAWLLNPPGGDGSRDLGLLARLFGVIQLYQLTLLASAYVLERRGALRDVRNLVLVLGPFLLDVTFTTGGTLAVAWQRLGALPTVCALALALSLAGLQLRTGLRLLGLRVGRAGLGALALGPLVVSLTPLIGVDLAGRGYSGATSLVTGCGVALLMACLAAAAGREDLRRLAPWVLLAATAHALANSWVYASPLPWALAPLLLVGSLTATTLWPRLTPAEGILRLALPAGAALCAGFSTGVAGESTPWRPILIGVAATQLVQLVRTPRSWSAWGLLLLSLDLAWGGASARESWQQLGRHGGDGLALAVLALISVAAGAKPAVTLGLGLASAGLGAGHLGLSPRPTLLIASQGLALLCAVSAWRLRGELSLTQLRALRLTGALGFGLAPAWMFALCPGDPRLGPWLAVTTLLCALGAGVSRDRLWACAALPGLAAGLVEVAPRSAAGWGVALLTGAFALVGLGLGLAARRELALEWLAQRSVAPRAATRLPRALALGLCGVLGVGALYGRNQDRSYPLRPDKAAAERFTKDHDWPDK